MTEEKKKDTELLPTAQEIIDTAAATGLPMFEEFKTMHEHYRAKLHKQQDVELRLSWEIGGQANLLMEAGSYGDETIESFAEEIEKSAPWVYSCRRLYKAYTWKDIQDKFLAHNIRPYAVARLGETADANVRAELERRLLEGSIGPSQIDKVKKKLLAAAEAGHDSQELSTEESAVLGESPDAAKQAHTILRKIFGGIEDAARMLEERLEETDKGLMQLDELADTSLYDAAEARVGSSISLLTDLRAQIVTKLADMNKVVA